ncbi:dicarboxylate transporter/tellurite-resistance protein TehA [Moraxella bovis]|uniref:Dicarboxylate transporter/tellurite-resistance protein TehA n=1 Tax=Moraxella bovis TaxID=476 RepID=A0AAX3ESE0_MORBO|nr:dicarboxylate transporter/tellurite-resistance protein TehA [Moraxella bovis]AWY20828.1 dicarboxylate transporter/tellurite-resistance protein TehA [Moraxella bovis]OOR91286.1 dicarboxylate transporter/tellurite-resistance protein TehA [Moraxella bovis]UYZ76496.1 dicarboxylate transporter/tellurite-resistance protein TehA [Moraxella bovis]UYZ77552.1 dicarboxylate transporter/tellurite-resistance protein TehA [Moraxella bovis]UYZ81948.1 dicarboxylate transporter/tellurite-resistance protein 
MNTDKQIFLGKTPLPASFFAMPLGLGTFALAWHHTNKTFAFGDMISQTLGILAIGCWLLFLGLYLHKALYHRRHWLDELYCPVRFAFVVLIFVSGMIVGELLMIWHYEFLGKLLICLCIVLQLLYGTWRIATLWQGEEFKQQSTPPPFYLPAVASNFTSAGALSLLGLNDWAMLFFGAGLLAWLMFEPVLLQHLRTQEIPTKLRATFGIILAPAFVGVNAYITTTGQVDMVARMLIGYGILQLLFLARLFTWVLKAGVGASLWSFSFGLASMASVGIALYQHNVLSSLGVMMFVFANIALIALLILAVFRLVQGKYFGIINSST